MPHTHEVEDFIKRGKRRIISHSLYRLFKEGKDSYHEHIIRTFTNLDKRKSKMWAEVLWKLHNVAEEHHKPQIVKEHGEENEWMAHILPIYLFDNLKYLHDKGYLNREILYRGDGDSLVRLIGKSISKSPSIQGTRLAEILLAIGKHADKMEGSEHIHQLYKSLIKRRDNSSLKRVNTALTLLDLFNKKKVKDYLSAFEKILENKGIKRITRKKKLAELSNILGLLAVHASFNKRKLPENEEELLEMLAKEYSNKRTIRKEHLNAIKENAGAYFYETVLHTLLESGKLDLSYLNKEYDLPNKMKEEIARRFFDYLSHLTNKKEKDWVYNNIHRFGKNRYRGLWDVISRYEKKIKINGQTYHVIFDKGDIIGQIKAIDEFPSCFTPPHPASFHGFRYILYPFIGHVIPGIARIVDERGNIVGRFTVMIDPKFHNIHITSDIVGRIKDKQIAENFALGFAKRINRIYKKLENTDDKLIKGVVIGGEESERGRTGKFVLQIRKLYDDHIYIKGDLVYIKGKRKVVR